MKTRACIVAFGLLAGCAATAVSVLDASVDAAHPTDASRRDSAIAATCDPTKPFGAPALIAGGVNTVQDEGAFRLLGDGVTAYYDIATSGDAGFPFRIMRATRDSQSTPWSSGSDVPEINAPNGAGHPSLSADGLNIYFNGNRANDAGGAGAGDLVYTASRGTAKDPFGTPGLVSGIYGGGIHQQLYPYVLPDNQAIYKSDLGWAFERSINTGSGFGWTTELVELITPDAGLGDIASGFATVTEDELTIFWAARRSDGGAKGDWDVWSATRQVPTTPFSNIRNVAELNTAFAEVPTFVTDDTCTLYLASNRVGGVGGYDIYVATRLN